MADKILQTGVNLVNLKLEINSYIILEKKIQNNKQIEQIKILLQNVLTKCEYNYEKSFMQEQLDIITATKIRYDNVRVIDICIRDKLHTIINLMEKLCKLEF